MSEKAFKKLRYIWLRLHIQIGLAIQIRFLRKQRSWTRKQLADISQVSLPTIFRLEYGLWSGSLNTLKKIANTFDVALIARFVAWSEVFPIPDSFDKEVIEEVK